MSTESFAGHGALLSKGLINDLVLLSDISEEGVAATLEKRHAAEQMYTYIGPVLVSVNPFKDLRNYGDGEVARYSGRYQHENVPHIFALTEEAYREMRLNREDQCVIVTGESGAGKTEAAKQILRYVAAVSHGSAEIERVKEQMIRSNPVLEAFGNAKTVMNNNSSRFGKYMTIVFDFKGIAVGGTVTQFLLEKGRVTGAAPGERSFSVFYQMIRGMPADERRDLGLPDDPSQMKYLRRGGDWEIAGVDDAAKWRETRAGLESLGVSGDTLREVVRTLAAVLWLGQIEFKQNASGCEPESPAGVRRVAKLLGADEAELAAALVARKVEVMVGGAGGAGGAGGGGGRQRSTSVVSLDVQNAVHTRDALAKAIYSRLFTWLVGRINSAIDPSRNMTESELAASSSIGVLDIYGFEIFERNSFEQLMINYTNERLQQVFIDNTLKAEQADYQSEGIQWTPIEYFNNQVVVDLIDGKLGIISLMDEACLFPKSTDATMIEKMDSHLLSHKHYERPRQQSAAFTVRHFAGDVVYAADGFLEKNRDPVRRDLLVLGASCGLALFAELFPAGEIEERGSRRAVTAATGFKRQLASLMDTLRACVPHYVRCVKPNDSKSAAEWDDKRCRHQVRYLGLVENVRVRRAGFAFRQDVSLFLRRYKMLSERTWPRFDGPDDGAVRALLTDRGVAESVDGFQLGKTKVFVREPQTLYELEEERARRLHDVATLISKTWRMFVQRKLYVRVIAARHIQSFVRGRAAREDYTRQRAALAVQSYWRGYAERERYARERAARTVQVYARGKLGREYARRFGAARMIIRNYRSYLDRKQYLRLRGEGIRLYGGRKLRRAVSLRRIHGCTHLGAPDQERVLGLLPPDDRAVAFSADVTKVNRKGAADPRVLVLTSSSVFLFDAVKFTVKLQAPLHELSGLAFSTMGDNFFVLRVTRPDGSRFDSLLESDFKTELLVAANTLFKLARGSDLRVEVADSLDLVIKKKVQRTVRFAAATGAEQPPVVAGAVAGPDKASKGGILVTVGPVVVASQDLLRRLGVAQQQ